MSKKEKAVGGNPTAKKLNDLSHHNTLNLKHHQFLQEAACAPYSLIATRDELDRVQCLFCCQLYNWHQCIEWSLEHRGIAICIFCGSYFLPKLVAQINKNTQEDLT